MFFLLGTKRGKNHISFISSVERVNSLCNVFSTYTSSNRKVDSSVECSSYQQQGGFIFFFFFLNLAETDKWPFHSRHNDRFSVFILLRNFTRYITSCDSNEYRSNIVRNQEIKELLKNDKISTIHSETITKSHISSAIEGFRTKSTAEFKKLASLVLFLIYISKCGDFFFWRDCFRRTTACGKYI